MDASESFLPDLDGTVAVSFREGTAFNATSSMPAFCAGSFAGFSCVTQSGRLVSQPATAKMAQTANACQLFGHIRRFIVVFLSVFNRCGTGNFHIAGNFTTAFNFDFGICNGARHLTGLPNYQSLSRDEFTFESAFYLGNRYIDLTFEIAAFGDFYSMALVEASLRLGLRPQECRTP